MRCVHLVHTFESGWKGEAGSLLWTLSLETTMFLRLPAPLYEGFLGLGHVCTLERNPLLVSNPLLIWSRWVSFVVTLFVPEMLALLFSFHPLEVLDNVWLSSSSIASSPLCGLATNLIWSWAKALVSIFLLSVDNAGRLTYLPVEVYVDSDSFANEVDCQPNKRVQLAWHSI